MRWLWLFLVFLLVGCQESKPQFVSTDITGADYGKDFGLIDHTGKPRTLADFRGKVVVTFFGFTQCPDVCPSTMLSLAEAVKFLGEDAKQVQVLFITVDPERDTKELLAQYVPAFNPDFLGLWGTPQAISETAKNFRVFYQKQTSDNSSAYTVDHTTGLYAFDPKGRLRLYIRHDEKPSTIAADLKLLIKEF
jgi:protein SCO1/2